MIVSICGYPVGVKQSHLAEVEVTVCCDLHSRLPAPLVTFECVATNEIITPCSLQATEGWFSLIGRVSCRLELNKQTKKKTKDKSVPCISPKTADLGLRHPTCV